MKKHTNEALRIWQEALRSSDESTRREAAEELPDAASDDRIAACLAPLLQDESPRVRMTAAESLGDVPCMTAAEALRACLAHERDELVRAHALSSLGLVGDSRDIAALLQAQAPGSPRAAIHATAGLFELVRRLSKQGLAAYLGHDSPEVRGAAAEMLATLVASRDDDDTRIALEHQLARESVPGNRENLRALIAFLRAHDEL